MWPERKDVVWVRKEDMLCVIDPPMQSTTTTMSFQLSATTTELIVEMFKHYVDKTYASRPEAWYRLVIYDTVQCHILTKGQLRELLIELHEFWFWFKY